MFFFVREGDECRRRSAWKTEVAIAGGASGDLQIDEAFVQFVSCDEFGFDVRDRSASEGDFRYAVGATNSRAAKDALHCRSAYRR